MKTLELEASANPGFIIQALPDCDASGTGRKSQQGRDVIF